MSLQPEQPAFPQRDRIHGPTTSLRADERPALVALGCVSLIVAVASDLLTVVVLTIAIPLVFMHNPDVHEDPNVLATMSGLLYTGAVVAALGAAGALVLGTLTRRRAVHLSEASYAARIATIGIRFAAPAAVLYAFLLCLFIFLGVTSG